jgi:hypothetical protein
MIMHKFRHRSPDKALRRLVCYTSDWNSYNYHLHAFATSLAVREDEQPRDMRDMHHCFQLCALKASETLSRVCCWLR